MADKKLIYAFVALSLLSILLTAGHLYNWAQADVDFAVGEELREQVKTLQEENERIKSEDMEREKVAIEQDKRVRLEAESVRFEMVSLRAEIRAGQSSQESITMLRSLLPTAEAHVENDRVVLTAETISQFNRSILDLQEATLRIGELESKVSLLTTQLTNRDKEVERLNRLFVKQEETIERFRKSAKKGAFRKILGHPATKLGLLAVGFYAGSKY